MVTHYLLSLSLVSSFPLPLLSSFPLFIFSLPLLSPFPSLAKIDDDGYIYITDRLKELIKYKGFQVAPAELEDVICTMPNIVDATVIPVSSCRRNLYNISSLRKLKIPPII